MKVTGPGSGLPPDATGEAGGVEPSGGKAFADKLGKTEKTDKAEIAGGAGSAAGVQATSSLVGDIGAALQAGHITPDQAIDKVVSRVLDRQLGPGAPPAVRTKVEAALRETLESDPLIVEKRKTLG